MTIDESRRRYGRPALTAETIEDQIWECEDRYRYYKLLSAAIEHRIIETEPFTKAFDTLYGQLAESLALMESYAAESCGLRTKQMAHRAAHDMQQSKNNEK